jgi:drug/metabolite transporter (DMT)-like permease
MSDPVALVQARAQRDAFVREVSRSTQLGAALPGILVLVGVALLAMGEGDPLRAVLVIMLSSICGVVMIVVGRAAGRGSLGAVTAVAAVWTAVTVLAAVGLVLAGDDDNRAMRVLFVGLPFAGMLRAWQARAAVRRHQDLAAGSSST